MGERGGENLIYKDKTSYYIYLFKQMVNNNLLILFGNINYRVYRARRTYK